MKIKSFTRFWVFTLIFALPCTLFAQDNKPSVNHVAICTHDLKKSIAFYNDVMELQKIPNPFHDTVHQWFRIGPDIALHVIAANCPAEARDINTHLCFHVASLPDFMKHLDEYHIKYGDWTGNYKKTQVRADGVLQIYFQDPDGYWIEVNNDK
ncbi:MAG TPA: VOC family protein [Mucilaginibacter sp.]|jgi:lactoylglutathione lyase|nr:VOC family protein [Mucilaginibacter sp.]